MTFRDSLSFTYNGESSEQYGIYNVNMESGMLEEELFPSRSLKTVSIKGRPAPYLQDFEYNPKKLNVTFAFKDKFDTDLLQRVSRWLFQDYYKPLVFTSHPERVYYAIVDGDSSIFHNAASQGYLKVPFVCDSPFSYSPVYEDGLFDYSTNGSSGTAYTFPNRGDQICNPLLEITKIGNGDIRIVNASNGGREFKITSLVDNEILTIDNENEDIVTSLFNTYRFNNHNGIYIDLVKGDNHLIIYGTCRIKWTYEFKYFV